MLHFTYIVSSCSLVIVHLYSVIVGSIRPTFVLLVWVLQPILSVLPIATQPINFFYIVIIVSELDSVSN